MFKGITPLFKQEEKSDPRSSSRTRAARGIRSCPTRGLVREVRYAQRLVGYCACLGLSFALSLGSWTRLVALRCTASQVGFVAVLHAEQHRRHLRARCSSRRPRPAIRAQEDVGQGALGPASALYLLVDLRSRRRLFVCFATRRCAG